MDLIAASGRSLVRMLSFERKRVYSFADGHDKNYRLLGQKGADLCELTQLGLPVPPGFIITTENFLEYVNHGEELRPELIKAYTTAIHGIEHQTGRLFGKPSSDHSKLPLLLAVRAGTAVIIPGIMDTILNVGMSDQVVEALIDLNPGLRRFALDLHRRFLYQYGILVQRNPAHRYEKILTDARERDHVHSDDKLSVDALTYIVSEYRRMTSVPEDPYEQLACIIEAMYQHSYSPRYGQEPILLTAPSSRSPSSPSPTVSANLLMLSRILNKSLVLFQLPFRSVLLSSSHCPTHSPLHPLAGDGLWEP
jgi:pyruvate, orthophosphate dikinase